MVTKKFCVCTCLADDHDENGVCHGKHELGQDADGNELGVVDCDLCTGYVENQDIPIVVPDNLKLGDARMRAGKLEVWTGDTWSPLDLGTLTG